jgi:hypothetical protein
MQQSNKCGFAPGAAGVLVAAAGIYEVTFEYQERRPFFAGLLADSLKLVAKASFSVAPGLCFVLFVFVLFLSCSICSCARRACRLPATRLEYGLQVRAAEGPHSTKTVRQQLSG